MRFDVEINPSPELSALIAAAPSFPARLLKHLATALAVSGQEIVGNSLKYRFTSERGPFPFSQNKLGRVTGRLRQSITATKPQIQEGSSTVTLGFGSNVKYFNLHEFGFTGNVPVRAHTRRGKPVRAHSRAVSIAARAPMQTEVRDQRTVDIVIRNAERAVRRLLADLGNNPATTAHS